jgi:hypothetical protein
MSVELHQHNQLANKYSRKKQEKRSARPPALCGVGPGSGRGLAAPTGWMLLT